MARQRRLNSNTGIYHVIARGNNKIDIFYDDEDRGRFMSTLKRYAKELSIRIYAYCLMTNHVHMVVNHGTDLTNLSMFMKKVLGSYVSYFNRKYERFGSLFQSRFISMPVEDMCYLRTLICYVHNNPASAGLSAAETYPWSSYKEYFGEPVFTLPEEIIAQFNGRETFFDFSQRYFAEKSNYNVLALEPYIKSAEREKSYISCISLILQNDNLQDWSMLGDCERQSKIRQIFACGVPISAIMRITGLPDKVLKSA